MDTTTAAVLIIIVFALIIIAAFVIYQRSKIKVQGPFQTGLEIDSSNEPSLTPAAIRARDIKSRKGGLVADDQTGRGIDAEQVEVEDDVLLSSRDAGQDPSPKPPPPA